MADVFISYTAADQAVAALAAQGMSAEGLSVFYDSSLVSGDGWDARVEDEFDAAGAVIVLWSPASRDQQWVRYAARDGMRRNILCPAMIADCIVPIEFAHVPPADLRGMKSTTGHAGWANLRAAVNAKLGVASPLRPTPAPRPSGMPQPTPEQPKPEPIAQAPRRTKVFLSYRRSDTEGVAGRVFDRFAAEIGKQNTVFDIDSIPYGVDFREHIKRELAACHTLVALIGPDWLARNGNGISRIKDAGDFVRLEIQTALDQKLRVIPALIGKARMPEPSDLPPELHSFCYLNAATIDLGRDFHAHLDRLLAATANA